MTTPAQDEFNELIASNKPHQTQHPEDRLSSETEDADADFNHSFSTLVESETHQSHRPSQSSLRSSKYNKRDSSDEDSDHSDDGLKRKSTPYYIPNHHGYNENTGPKGVIADARAFEREKHLRSKHTYVRTEGMVLPKMQHLDDHQRKDPNARDSTTDDELDDEEDDFMRSWREKRGVELKTSSRHNIHPGRRRGRYGTMKTVDPLGFLDAVEKCPRSTVVLVYVFDEEFPLSESYHVMLEQLAPKYADVCFIALHYEDAEMEHAGVPAVLAYKDGEQFASLTPLRESVTVTGDDHTPLETALIKHAIL